MYATKERTVTGATYARIGGENGLLINLTPFTGSSKPAVRGMSAVKGHVGHLGRMPNEARTIYLRSAMAGEIIYTVLSYGTPIAWVLRDEDVVIMPRVSYSVTTSRHQGLVRAWLTV